MTHIQFLTILFFCTSHFLLAQTLADFETVGSTPVLTPAGAVVMDNPDFTGNTSAKVAYYQKPSGDWHAIYMNFASKKNVSLNDRLTFKLRSSTQGRVFVKIVNNGSTILESWAPEYNFRPTANVWTECQMDISSIANQEFDRIEVNASVNNDAMANVYIDDFKLINAQSPNGEPIIDVNLSAQEITLGESLQFDASVSVDLDGTISSFTWNFGDGSTTTGDNVSHTYTSDGIFHATLVVVDNEGHQSFWNSTINVLPSTGKLGTIRFTTETPAQYEKVEGVFLVKGTYSNVYDPDEIKVDAIITRPDLSSITVPCFFYQRVNYKTVVDQWAMDGSLGYWMLRFSSAQAGTHQVNLQLTDGSGTTTSSSFPVTINPGSKKGYIKQDAESKQHYRHTSGEPYYPLGINAAWDNTTNYTSIISNLATGGANLVRYWQVPFDRQGLEWRNGSGFYKGLGVYSQEAAAEQDSIFSLCEKNNVYLQVTIFQHGMFSETVNSNWVDNPYSNANGGPLTKSEEFFYNANAKARTKKLLRYIVARWGYSANLFAWELFNEVNFTGNFPSQTAQWLPAVMTWHDEMGQYIKTQDPFDHPITTSSDESHLDDMDKLIGLDIVQYHLYTTNLLSTQIQKDKALTSIMTRTGVINGEYGQDVTTADVPFDMQRVSIWTGMMTQVPHLMWKWEGYTSSLWANLFLYPAQYLQDEDFVAQGLPSDWLFDVSFGTSKLQSSGFRSGEDFYAIIYDPSNRNSLSNVSCNFAEVPSGNYTITYMNVLNGSVTTEDKDFVTGTKTLVLPTFSKAIAIKVKLNYAIVTSAEQLLSSSHILVYPNPATDFIQLDVSAVTDLHISVQLVDAFGKRVITTTLNSNDYPEGVVRIDLKRYSLSSGVYSLILKTEDDILVKRFVYGRP